MPVGDFPTVFPTIMEMLIKQDGNGIIHTCMVLLSQLSAPLFSAGHTCKSCWPIWPGTGICCYSCSWFAAAVRAAIGQLLEHMRLEHVGLLFARCVIQGHCTMLS